MEQTRFNVSLDTVIRDVRAVTPTGVRHGDIEIADGRIVDIVAPGQGGEASRVIDGGGREAFPGVIDPHVHFRAYESMGVDGDGFDEMVEAAAQGGMTSVVAFVMAPKERAGIDAIAPIRTLPNGSAVDFGIHHVLWPRQENLARLHELCEFGVRSFKMFMAYPERGFMFDGESALAALHAVARVGGLLLVHCEEGNTIRELDQRARDQLGTTARIFDYLEARPESLETVAVQMLGLWASVARCPLYIVHVSTASGLTAAAELVRNGLDVTIETCPQYLQLDPSTASRLGPLAKFAPALRTAEHQAALWRGLRSGIVKIVGSDHSGHCGDIKQRIAEERGIFEVPYGMPGLETLLPVLYTHGVLAGRLSRTMLAEVISTNAARRFGWYPRKGSLQPDADADIVLIEPSERRAVDPSSMRTLAGYSPYEGMELSGWPSLTMLRGTVTFDGTSVVSRHGRFLATHPVAVPPEGLVA